MLIAFAAIGMAANLAIYRSLERAAERSPEARQRHYSPESSIARIIDTMAEALGKSTTNPDRLLALKKIREANGKEFPLEIRLVTAAGQSLEGATDLAPPAGWDPDQLPTHPYELHSIGPPPEAGPPMESSVLLPVAKGQAPQYLYIRRKAPLPRPPHHPGPPAFLSLITVLVSVLIGSGVALWLVLRSFRTKAELADQVIAELQSGNLKVRFPIDRMDELGGTMLRFNRMAEEIERLVEQLRESERTRTNLLQELAHDLRTPVASLKSLLETLESKGPALDKTLHAELTALALKEVDYFERLVEDLLVLARIGEPRYRGPREPFPLGELIEDEIDSILTRRAANGKTLEIDFQSHGPVKVVGDTHLLRRMIRNALENGYDFARSKLVVKLGTQPNGTADIEILDDGPGFTPEQLNHFGTRHMTRQVGVQRGGRISIGLGSVIMRTIVEMHHGKLTASNGERGGGRIVFEIPIFSS